MTKAQQKEAEHIFVDNGLPANDGAMDENGVHHYNASNHLVTGKEKRSIGKGGVAGGTVIGGGDAVHHYNANDYLVSNDKGKGKEKGQQSSKHGTRSKDGGFVNAALVVIFVVISTLLCSVASGIILRKLYQICNGNNIGQNDELGKYSKVATDTIVFDEDDGFLEMTNSSSNKHQFVDEEYGEVDDEDSEEEEEKKEDDNSFGG